MVVMSSIITSAAGAGAGHRAVGSLVDTTVGRQPPPPPPPQVEDVAEDGDGMRVPGLELSPVSSEASFESDTDDKQGSEVPKTPQTPASPAMSHSSVSLITASAQSRHDMTGVTPSFMDELRTMIKQEIAGHLTSMDPTPSPAITPPALMNSMFGTAYPSPPPSVVSTSQFSSPQSTSPCFTTADVLPESPTVRFRSRIPPIIHAQPQVYGIGETQATSAIQNVGVFSEAKAWGVLFDDEGYSTQRLEQTLHSLACRVIAAFGVPGTDLITPDKMQNFYAKYRVENEEFPLQDAFKPCKNTTFERTQYMYQDLDCPYYLSQAVPQAHPTIPGLTRMGFVKWMTINILAYPDQESRRFALLLPDLAPLHVIGPDGAQECLPYTLPRNLFPATHDKKVRRLLDEAMLDCLEDHDVSSPLPAARSYEVTPVIAQGSGSEQGRFWGRANFEASGVSTAQRSFVTLPPPPVGQHSTRAKSPVAADRCSASVPNMDRFADAMNLVRKGDTGIVSRKNERNRDYGQERGREKERESLVLSEPNRRNSYQDGQGRRDAGRRGRF